MKKIPLYHKNEIVAKTIVDDEDFNYLNSYRWYFHPRGYAHRWENCQSIFMHRLILGLTKGDGKQGDHIDRNKLNNRRNNLRVVNSQAEQMQNKGIDKHNRSGYRGVTWDSIRGKWRANVMINGKQKFLGYFTNPEEAGKVASEYRKKHMPFYVE